jgi:hypothetical protein
VRLADAARFDGAVVCNARGIGNVSAIDDTHLPDAAGRVDALRNAYDAVPRDPI